MIGILRSLRLAVWLLAGTLLFLFAGSMILPARPDAYAGMNDALLFDWLRGVASNPLHFWFWAVLLLLALLTVNTVVCSLDSLWKKRSGADFWLRISPQLMHLGFLLILLAHLLSASSGFRVSGTLARGSAGVLPDGKRLHVSRITMDSYPGGMPRAWWADVELRYGSQPAVRGTLGPNRPLFVDGVGVYLKSVRYGRQGPVAVLHASRDPGALWALAGACLFTAGNFILLFLKVRRER